MKFNVVKNIRTQQFTCCNKQFYYFVNVKFM